MIVIMYMGIIMCHWYYEDSYYNYEHKYNMPAADIGE